LGLLGLSGLLPPAGIIRTQRFGNWICFCPQVTGWEAPTLLGPLERANLHHWTTNLDCYLPYSEPSITVLITNVITFLLPLFLLLFCLPLLLILIIFRYSSSTFFFFWSVILNFSSFHFFFQFDLPCSYFSQYYFYFYSAFLIFL
jgi:hypothetical protein